MLELLIAEGVLLKRFTLPYKPVVEDIKAPRGWTPDRSVPWIQNKADELLTERDLVGKKGAREFALMAAEREYGVELRKRKLPWDGWVPVGLRPGDRGLRKAYRELFIRSNPEMPEGLPEHIQKVRGEWPPDGRYTYHKRVMEPVTDETGPE